MNSNFIKSMVNGRQIENNRYSVFVTALEHARELSGYDKETRKEKRLTLDVERNSILELGQSHIGLINYLLILDMLGSVFKKLDSLGKVDSKGKSTPNLNNIYYVLTEFSNLKPEDKCTIKALRNCLAHNYSLLNVPDRLDETHPKNGQKNITKNVEREAAELHAFSICWTKQSSLIKCSDTRLTRSSAFNDDEKYYTKICAESLIDLVEDIFQQIKEGVNNGTVEPYISDHEIKSRFTYSH